MGYEIREQMREALPTAVGEAALTAGELDHWFGPTYGSVYAACEHQGVHPVGMPFARFRGGRGRRLGGLPHRSGVEPDPAGWRAEVVQPYRSS